MKQWEKALMSELNKKAKQTNCIDFEEFCRDFGIGTKYKHIHFADTCHALECWLDKHQEFEFVGDDYEPYWWKSPVLVYTKHLWSSDDVTEKRGLELLETARLCSQKYAYEQADGYAVRAHKIFVQLAESNPKYYLYAAECSKMSGEMRAERYFDDSIPAYLKAVREYKLLIENTVLLTVDDIYSGNTAIGKHLVLSYILDNKGLFGIYGGEFTNVDVYLHYMLYQCYDDLGYQFLKRYRDSSMTDAHKIKNALKHYQNAAECMEFIEKNIDKEPQDSFIRDEYQWLYAGVLSELVDCAGLTDNTELAEKCFRKVIQLGEDKASNYLRMAEIFEKAGQHEKAENCLKQGCDNILAKKRVYEKQNTDDEENRKERIENFDKDLSELENTIKNR